MLGLAAAVAGCGADVQSPDLFVITRTGQGARTSLLVNDGGTIRCDGGPARPLPDPLLLQARDLAAALDKDVKNHLHITATRGSASRFTVTLPDGTLRFPDTAAARHVELARAELFAVQARAAACRSS
jgi:hypothetical protein